MEEIIERLKKLDMLDAIDSKVNDVKSTLEALERDVSRNCDKLEKVEKRVDDIQLSTKTLSSKLSFLDREWRRRNLMIFGYEEKESGWLDLRHKILDFLSRMLKEAVLPQQIERIDRVGVRRRGPAARPVRVIFADQELKWKILSATPSLEGSNISVGRDYTEEERADRKALVQYRNLIREEGVEVKLKGFKLLVNGSLLSLGELQKKYGEKDKRKRIPDSPGAMDGVGVQDKRKKEDDAGTTK
ncbi:Hypothetical protein NTJ_04001 [Nesidiocoris tenuis]|uniref:Uncharacterized protein n=1 Tax=Nesidiocoris tenuis TaxID=355587 RepID=A0ABN7AGV7_9HEMI|nr:Hypothetical protein NTJ_04001 [Nesidiocoris tenuis]